VEITRRHDGFRHHRGMFGFLPGASACCQQSAAVYRAHFCGLGTSLHERHGAWARWLVNRDSTLLTLLGSALAPCSPPTRLATCCNRFAMPRLLLDDSSVMQYVSAVTVCGLSAKLDDEIEDEAGWRRRAARLLSRCLDEPVSDALGLLHGMGFPVQQVRAHLAGQKSVEIQGQNLARCARPTSAAYGEIVSHLAYVAGVPQARDGLREIGESLGFLVYARDAWDDWARDKRRGQFNPLQAFPQLMGRREAVLPSMRAAVERMRAVLAALPLRRHRDLVASVLVGGAEQRLAQVADGGGFESRPRPSLEKAKDRSKQQRTSCWDGCCDCGHCCDVIQCCKPGKGGSHLDCNPCDGDGCGCCGCDCT
jgi:hypothetical protein